MSYKPPQKLIKDCLAVSIPLISSFSLLLLIVALCMCLYARVQVPKDAADALELELQAGVSCLT